jgi:hypothetical protein
MEGGDLVLKQGENWETAAGIQQDGALLVRPDSVVGWRCRSTHVDCLSELKRTVDRLL